MTDNPLRSPSAALPRLYYYPQTRAGRVRWMLEELEVEYDLVRLDLSAGEHHDPTYLAIHPMGKVPSLLIDDLVLIESLGICLYLADRYPEWGFAPACDDLRQRATYYGMLSFAAGSLEPAVNTEGHRRRAVEADVGWISPGPGTTPFPTAIGYLDSQLQDRSFLLGEQFSTADIVAGSMMIRASGMGMLDRFPSVEGWVANLQARPAWERAHADW